MDDSKFNPDWVSCPGQSIAAQLVKRSIGRQKFFEFTGLNEDDSVRLIIGEYKINSELAVKLSNLVGGSENFWLSREKNYRLGLQRLEDTQPHQVDQDWLNNLRPKDLIKKGWVKLKENETLINSCLRFFGVETVTEWRSLYQKSLTLAAFRKSPTITSSIEPITAWFRRCELKAALIEREEWDKLKFTSALKEIRNLVRNKDPKAFFKPMQAACAKAGVALIVEESPKGCAVSGATRFIESNYPIIMLSLRHKTDDHFWFTFFHEAAHLILHDHQIFIDYDNADYDEDELEHEANMFSQQHLISEEHEKAFQSLNYNTKRTGRDILRFAHKANLSPGIVVGQLQFRKGLQWTRLNDYKRKFSISDFI